MCFLDDRKNKINEEHKVGSGYPKQPFIFRPLFQQCNINIADIKTKSEQLYVDFPYPVSPVITLHRCLLSEEWILWQTFKVVVWLKRLACISLFIKQLSTALRILKTSQKHFFYLLLVLIS